MARSGRSGLSVKSNNKITSSIKLKEINNKVQDLLARVESQSFVLEDLLSEEVTALQILTKEWKSLREVERGDK